MPDHGRLFDNFSAQASHTHGGSYFDAGFGLQTLQEAHGKLYDLFGAPKGTSEAHGERYDEFGWEAMPAIHGQHFDTGFQAPVAGEGGEHGTTWFDVFRGGRTQARVMVDGRDLEGVVIECHPDHAVVRDHAGQTHEVGLSQFLAYRTPNEHQASPQLPESGAEAPSARNDTAHGNFGTTGSPALTSEPSKVERVSEGPGNPDRRSGLPSGLMDTFARLGKRASDDTDVGKEMAHAAYPLGKGATSPDVSHIARLRRHAVTTGDHDFLDRAAAAGHSVATIHHIASTNPHISTSLGSAIHRFHTTGTPIVKSADSERDVSKDLSDGLDALKSVDATETAVQGSPSDTVKTVGHRNNCPRGGSAPCGAEVDGRCSLCRAQVHDHEAVGKSAPSISGSTGDLGIEVPERDHKSTDHHTSGKKPGRCPHCGAALDELEHQTEQGQPTRTHKCVGTGVDVLKALVEAQS